MTGNHQKLYRLANLGWCDRRELDACFVACGGEVRTRGGHDYYWHPLVGKPSSATKTAAVRPDAGTAIRSYARRVARLIEQGATVPVMAATAPEPAPEPEPDTEVDRYRPPVAAPALDRGGIAMRSAAPTDPLAEWIDGAIAEAVREDRKAQRAEERAAERAARLASEVKDVYFITIFIRGGPDAPEASAGVVRARGVEPKVGTTHNVSIDDIGIDPRKPDIVAAKVVKAAGLNELVYGLREVCGYFHSEYPTTGLAISPTRDLVEEMGEEEALAWTRRIYALVIRSSAVREHILLPKAKLHARKHGARKPW